MFKRIYLVFVVLFSGGKCHFDLVYRLPEGGYISEWDKKVVSREVRVQFLFKD